MAYVDYDYIKALWERIGTVFARKTKAAASLVLSGTSLVMNAVSGDQLASVDLGSTFATDAEAVGSVTFQSANETLTVAKVSGASSTLNLGTKFANKTNALGNLVRNGTGIIFRNVNGTNVGSIDMADAFDTRYIASVAGSGHTLYFYDKDGNVKATVEFPSDINWG